MAVNICLKALSKFFSSDRDHNEGKSVYKPFPSDYLGGTFDSILDSFSFTQHDEEWSKLYEKSKSGKVDDNEIMKPRLKVAFCESATKDLRRFYLSGSDDHPITDVDVLRLGAHYSRAEEYRMEHIKERLQ